MGKWNRAFDRMAKVMKMEKEATTERFIFNEKDIPSLNELMLELQKTGWLSEDTEGAIFEEHKRNGVEVCLGVITRMIKEKIQNEPQI